MRTVARIRACIQGARILPTSLYPGRAREPETGYRDKAGSTVGRSREELYGLWRQKGNQTEPVGVFLDNCTAPAGQAILPIREAAQVAKKLAGKSLGSKGAEAKGPRGTRNEIQWWCAPKKE
jgi:hypothetical protein